MGVGRGSERLRAKGMKYEKSFPNTSFWRRRRVNFSVVDGGSPKNSL